MKRFLTLERISRHRTVFMGLAIVFIVLCHNTLVLPQRFALARRVVSAMLQCGVDIFMLLSGLGLVYSIRNNSETSIFWKKRFRKILPPYIVVTVVYGIAYVGWANNATLSEYIWMYSLISFFWEGELTAWFIAAILVLYIVFPFLYAILQKHSKLFAMSPFAVAAVCLGLSYLPSPSAFQIVNEIFISRLPAFLVGMILAKAILDEKRPKVPAMFIWMIWIVSSMLAIWYLVCHATKFWVIVRLLFLPFSLSGMLLLGILLDKCQKNRCFYRMLSFLGGITLEIYLLHERTLVVINAILSKFDTSPILLSFVANTGAIVLSVVGAWILQKGICFVFATKRPAQPGITG